MPLRELSRAGQEVGVDVRLGRGHDEEILLRGDVDISVDVALGIDDDRLFCALAADEVRILRQLGIEDLPQEHLATLAWLEIRSIHHPVVQ